ncbi:MAG: phosphate acetyltransferase [Bacteroidetes bacterium]|nr:phosphate acetyltransferase [Bacteroidota bacterium]
MDLYKDLIRKSRKKKKTIIFPESGDSRVISAVKRILKEKTAEVILIDNGKNSDVTIPDCRELLVIDNNFSSQFAEDYHRIRSAKKKEQKKEQSLKEISDPLTFSCMLLRNNFADGLIAGSVYSTSEVLRNAISIIGTSKNNKTVSSFFLFTFPAGHVHGKKIIAYADCGVVPDPDAEQMSDIALSTAENFRKITGIQPRVAFLSFSTKGSAESGSLDKIIEAVRITKKRAPKMIIDGELQFDAAFVPEVAERKNPNGKIKGDANVFIFPDLNSGNIAYKITERIGGASATGPVLQGLSKPVMDLSRGCSAEDIFNMSLIISNI